MTSTAAIGIRSLFGVMDEFARRGYTVSSPVSAARYDFVAEKAGRFVRVQVRSGVIFNGGRELMVRTEKPITCDDADMLVIHNPSDGCPFFVPVTHVPGQGNIRIRLKPYVYKVKTQIALDGDSYRSFPE